MSRTYVHNARYVIPSPTVRRNDKRLLLPTQMQVDAAIESMLLKRDNSSPVIVAAQHIDHQLSRPLYSVDDDPNAIAISHIENSLILSMEGDAHFISQCKNAIELFSASLQKPRLELRETIVGVGDKANLCAWEELCMRGTNFWMDWYQGFLDGKPLDWELQRRVALIPDPIWEEGPEAVAREIERIKTEWLAEQLPMAETIELNPEIRKFHAVPIPVENAPFTSALLDQVEDALEDCLDGHNGLRADMGDARKIKRVLSKYRDDPQNAELALTRVATSLRKQIHEDQWLPENTDNTALLSSVEDAVRGIRSNHPEVAQNRQEYAKLAIQELSEEDRNTLEQAKPILEEMSEARLADDFAADISELLNDAITPPSNGAPALPGADVSTRIFSRASKMALLVDQIQALEAKGADVFDSNRAKSLRLASGIGAFLYSLVQIGLRLFGVL
ncbi:hypothetical protein SAMN04488118_102115 [Epibacterium ulvae]|uniref:Uncharacterized protein n=1 Tax=Epibacterium ulvae TaxID=1156985 RepID=A0A1G5PVJ8_9RHOB|nr:hypothetical protein [Epibacterium ulvae]SCZ53280.1 hypothetical protein SAMN04488118_102115 [Epibacterium ulvae]